MVVSTMSRMPARPPKSICTCVTSMALPTQAMTTAVESARVKQPVVLSVAAMCGCSQKCEDSGSWPWATRISRTGRSTPTSASRTPPAMTMRGDITSSPLSREAVLLAALSMDFLPSCAVEESSRSIWRYQAATAPRSCSSVASSSVAPRDIAEARTSAASSDATGWDSFTSWSSARRASGAGRGPPLRPGPRSLSTRSTALGRFCSAYQAFSPCRISPLDMAPSWFASATLRT
mmetsp:Transcript_157016/g.481609  ORF Transcript_157016/g.481609 Transcript_157016/m.481609 type:complete len:234 (+) Transcript_157016:173-874(+)